jgi:glycosyltransferase involved in cell wall biosynthesis
VVRKVLFICPWPIFPPHFGGSDRTYNLVKNLSNWFEILVLYTDFRQIRGVKESQGAIPNVCLIKAGPNQRWAQLLSPFLLYEGLRIIGREKPDVIICEDIWPGLHATLLHFLTGVPFILDEFNAEYVRYERMGRRAGLLKAYEKICCQVADCVFCVSKADQKHIEKLGIASKKIWIVPNGIDVDKFAPNPDKRREIRHELGISDNTPIVLFFGKLDYQPNFEAIEIIFRHIMPRVLASVPAARFVIAGYAPPAKTYQHSNLIFPGMVPKIEDYINASDLVIAPLTSGGGVKFKILQSIACGKYVVTTRIGAEGIEAADDFMAITDDWDVFAETVVERLTTYHLIDPMSQSFVRFLETYAWENVAARACEAIHASFTHPRR